MKIMKFIGLCLLDDLNCWVKEFDKVFSLKNHTILFIRYHIG